MSRAATPVEAVIFDWGGTLTPWHDVDFEAESAALALAVLAADDEPADPASPAGPGSHARLLAAGQVVWARSRDEHRSATVSDVFAEAGLAHDPDRLRAYRDFWEPHTVTDPDVRPTFEALRRDGLRIGVLSNTLWPREWHRDVFERDGVAHLIDGDVYSSEIAHTKPAPEAFLAAARAVGVSDPTRCVYVGDRLFEDVWGPQQVGMRAIHLPHSRIPSAQVGHTDGRPDAVVDRLIEIPPLLRSWANG